MTIYGWDTSDFDHDRGLNASKIMAGAKEGIRFFTHKATELSTKSLTVHTTFGADMVAARSGGIPFLGAYVVPRSGVAASAAAAAAIKFVKAQAPWLLAFTPVGFRDFFWQVDTEHWSYDMVSAATGEALAVELVKQSGHPAVNYASHGMYGDGIPGTRPLWNSNYRDNPVADFHSAYTHGGGDNHPGWARYSNRVPKILQYGSRCTIGGQHTSDANAFRGTDEDFAVMLGEHKPVPTPPPPPVHVPPKFPLRSTDWYGTNDGTQHSHSGVYAVDQQNIRRIQSKLIIHVDGDFGGGTHAAVVAFQRHAKLLADGKVGPTTWAHLFA